MNIYNKKNEVYKDVPRWAKPTFEEPEPESPEEKPWICKEIEFNFRLSMPRWAWILVYSVAIFALFYL